VTELPNLSFQVLQIISGAQSYLQLREAQTVDPSERSRIQYWHATLQDSAEKVMTEGLVVPSEDQPLHAVITQNLELARQRIGQLHPSSDYAEVDLCIRNLYEHLQSLLAGPHGSGGGRP
jgi:hypothetical protein